MVASLSLKQLADTAGAAEELDCTTYEVFAHGTIASFGKQIIASGGKCLSATGGAKPGTFFTVPDVAVAQEFAKRSCAKHPGEKPLVVGIALSRTLVDRLKANKLLKCELISEPPATVSKGAVEHVFKGGALEDLAKHAFFFLIGETSP